MDFFVNCLLGLCYDLTTSSNLQDKSLSTDEDNDGQNHTGQQDDSSYIHIWPLVFECIDISLIAKREERPMPIINFIRLLLQVYPHLPLNIGLCALSLIHKMLLRYPRIRNQMIMFSPLESSHILAEDMVSDMAMQALAKNDNGDTSGQVDAFSTHSGKYQISDDGSWSVPLYTYHNVDTFARRCWTLFTSREIKNIPLRYEDGSALTRQDMADNLDRAFNSISDIHVSMIQSRSTTSGDHGNGDRVVVMSKKQKNKLKAQRKLEALKQLNK